MLGLDDGKKAARSGEDYECMDDQAIWGVGTHSAFTA